MVSNASGIISETDSRMKKVIESLNKDFATIRTGRANTALVEHIQVEYYGNTMPLNQLGTITAPEARMLAIQPWDKNAIAPIEKAILKSDLGLTPANDGAVVRLILPPLTEERRKELAKTVSKRVEEGRVALRNIRRDSMDKVRTKEKDKELSQDDSRRAQDQVQKVTDTFMAQIDTIAKAKEKEVLGT